jgi:hypothetical protein
MSRLSLASLTIPFAEFGTGVMTKLKLLVPRYHTVAWISVVKKQTQPKPLANVRSVQSL